MKSKIAYRLLFVLGSMFIITACVFCFLAIREDKTIDDDERVVKELASSVIIEPSENTSEQPTFSGTLVPFDSVSDLDNTHSINSNNGVSGSSVNSSSDNAINNISNNGNSNNISNVGQNVVPDYYLYRSIDFAKLQAINTDIARWICIPDTNIDYYVMQNTGRSDYLWKNIYNQYSSWGSLFSPLGNDTDKNAHSIIFGHNMLDKSVAFSSLSTYYATSSSCDYYPYIYVYYSNMTQRWRVWCACDGNVGDMVYSYPYDIGSLAYSKLIDSIANHSRYMKVDKPDNNTHLLVLSTCSGYSHDSRFYVVCVPDIEYNYDTNIVTYFS